MRVRTVVTTLLLLLVLVLGVPGAEIVPPTNLKVVEIAPIAMPTSPTDATTETIWLDVVWIANSNGSARTITIADKQGSAITVIPTISVAANTFVFLKLWNTRMSGGFTWSASGSGVTCYYRGFKKP